MSQEVTAFYRCLSCFKVIEMTEWLADGHGFCVCGAKRFSPTMVTTWEAFKYLLGHPSVLIATLWEKIK